MLYYTYIAFEELMHMNREETIAKVTTIINHIRPWIQGDGGDLEFVSLEDGVVTVRLTGACVGCVAIDTTLNDGIKSWILDEVPEVRDVVLEQPEVDYSQFYDIRNY